MNLFNRYQSRTLQFALALLSRLEAEESLGEREINVLAGQYGLDYADQVLNPLCRAEILTREGRSVRLAGETAVPRLPAGRIEREYLAAVLDLPEAELFLKKETVERLRTAVGPDPTGDEIQYYAAAGEKIPEKPGPEGFRTLLRAVRERRLIRYVFRTRDDSSPREAVTLPWKLEYSAYDRRWWVLLYDGASGRTIKARLDNLDRIALLGRADISGSEITAAMDRLLAPDPAVLEIRKTRGALERCFLTFEGQMFVETEQVSPDSCRMSFRYYTFDESEILRRLLYLGPAVTPLSPEPLRRKLADLIDSALKDNPGPAEGGGQSAKQERDC